VDNIVFAGVTPHGGLLIPLVSGPDGAKALASQTAMAEMGRRMAEARPETVVIIEPHSLLVDGAISILDSAQVQGTVGPGITIGGPQNGFSLSFDVDHELAAVIATASRAEGVPAVRVRNCFEATPLTIYWGTLIPLWFLGAAYPVPPRVVVASAGNMHLYRKEGVGHFGQEVPREGYIAFGRAVRAAAAQIGRRVAFIASLDLGHRHRPDGPFGFDPASVECDAAVTEAVRANALERMLGYDADWIDRGLTEAVEPLLALHGVLEGTNLRAEVLSYEVPTYYGMMCAAYA
jgi:aromatic ring-opening dioxygenase LigB subunit